MPPKLCITGALTGANSGDLPTQAEALIKLFSGNGYSVIAASSHPNRYRRLSDILWTLVKKRKAIDIHILQVFSGASFVQADLASLFASVLNIPTVMILRGGSLPDFSKKNPRWAKRVFSRAGKIIAPSGYLARNLDWLGYPIEVIPNIIDISNYPYRQRENILPHLFWMRSFFWFYEPDMALRVANRLQAKYPDLRLTMAGPDKGLLDQTRRRAEELQLADKTDFPGFLGMSEKVTLANRHDIYLNTNTIDNMPVSVLEMSALGLPIVATAVGGIPDLLEHERTALLVPDGDDRAMAESIQRLLSDSNLTRTLSRNGRELAESCSARKVIQQWENLFSRITYPQGKKFS
jgi:glycosyltransferase involved in cell wall biosynthesis